MGPPRPFDPQLPLYLCAHPLPPYRHVPGETPHPRTHPRGHSHGRPEGYEGPPLTEENWRDHAAYLRGADLFNQAYWWEAHEQWEGPWRQEAAGSLCALYLQGLIQVSAALIKWHQRNERGVERLAARGRARLEQVRQARPAYLGLDLVFFLGTLERFLQTHPVPSPEAYARPERTPLLRLQDR